MLDNYFSTCYGVDQLAARKVMRLDQLEEILKIFVT